MTQPLSLEQKDYDHHAGCLVDEILDAPLEPFSGLSKGFLSDLSNALMKSKEAKLYPDIISFAFWCRKANLNREHRAANLSAHMIGRGLALHITPSNVPVNFAFSFAFGLLSGNANIVRVPGADFVQRNLILRYINQLLDKAQYEDLKRRNSFIYYERNDVVNSALSMLSDCRLIWGGDETVSYFKQLPTKPRTADIYFADRYSLSLIGAAQFHALADKDQRKLCNDFYNDAFLFKQLACSSSHLVIWQGSSHDIKTAKDRFWSQLRTIVEDKSDFSDTDYVNRFSKTASLAMKRPDLELINSLDDEIYRAKLPEGVGQFEEFRIGYGFFSEIDNLSMSDLAQSINEKYQTISYFGIDAETTAQQLLSAGIKGVDRIVPIGRAIELGLIWDGYDIIRSLSRIMTVK